MRASALWLVFAVAGCNSGSGKIADNAVVAAVSADQKFIAYLTGASRLPNQTPTGTLAVKPLGGGAATPLGDGAFAATFNRTGDVLLFGSGPQPSTDMTSKTIYGALSLWSPSTTGAIKLTSGLAVQLAAPPDNSWALIFDAPAPMRTQMGNVILVRASECAGTACKPVMLAQNVDCTFATFSIDGKFGAYVVHSGTGVMSTYDTYLVNIASGAATKLASSALGNSAAFSPDGNLVATTGSQMMMGFPIPLQLQVFSTGSGMAVPWAAQPAQTGTLQLEFADSQTLIIRTSTVQQATAVYKTTASAATQLAMGTKFIYVQRVPAAASRWLFASANGNGQVPLDWQVFDLQAATPSAAQLASSGNYPVVSDDGTTVRILDNYDATAQTGTLFAGTLGTGAPQMIAAGVPNVGPQFAAATSKVLYLDNVNGNATLTEWSAGKSKVVAQNVYDFRARAMPDTIYYAVTAADPVTGASTPGIYSEALPSP